MSAEWYIFALSDDVTHEQLMEYKQRRVKGAWGDHPVVKSPHIGVRDALEKDYDYPDGLYYIFNWDKWIDAITDQTIIRVATQLGLPTSEHNKIINFLHKNIGKRAFIEAW